MLSSASHRPVGRLLLRRALSRPTGSRAVVLSSSSSRGLSSHAEEGRAKAHQMPGGTGGPKARWYQPWLSDKSLYPVLGITVATVVFALYFAPAWIYATPQTRVDKDRRQSVVYEKQAHESVPMSPRMYTLSRKLTKEVIYPTTLGSESAGSDDAMAAKEEAKNKASRHPEKETGAGDAGTTGSNK